ncbi:NnrU family protein [Marivita sp. S6314]|uniref:NnrU family protein n=1 Tax=Marivita sp. S6314 TaxID=2926406 RepID=UPI001FF3BA76|nr:NnrU family protein [Marivita sp. S6314]MCK0150772.1 NnrU family protein [Marivita sp. S6314]
MGWFEFTLALAVFFISHAALVRPPVKGPIVAQIGARWFSVAYSAVSIGLLVWVVIAAGRAPFVELWPWSPWQSWGAMALVLAACCLFAVALGAPNPFSFGGGDAARFDPAQPGIVRLTRHPFLWVLLLWAFAHVIPNGNLAHVILFGGFAGFAALGMRMVDRRRQRLLGPDWAKLDTARRQTPISQIWHPKRRTLQRVLMGGTVFALLLVLHPVVIGIDPWP